MIPEAMAVFEQKQPVLIDHLGGDFHRRVTRVILGEGDEQRVELDRLFLDLACGKRQGQ